jgi:hypothetical protein
MTKRQADEMLSELRAIRKLMEEKAKWSLVTMFVPSRITIRLGLSDENPGLISKPIVEPLLHRLKLTLYEFSPSKTKQTCIDSFARCSRKMVIQSTRLTMGTWAWQKL